MASLLVLVVLSACQQLSTSSRLAALQVQTDGSTFVRDPAVGSATVPFSVVNRGRSTLYLARCGERIMAVLDRWESGRWVQHGDACLTDRRMDPWPVSPSATLTSTHHVLQPGRYRLRPGVSTGGTKSWTVAFSNEFTIE
jgi:hypothetical protein